ncbi:MAG: LruC domain-containing protein [Bacteroidales bacterium]|nr:LruC domain-containing protein [Bacteroidales bacterium]
MKKLAEHRIYRLLMALLCIPLLFHSCKKEDIESTGNQRQLSFDFSLKQDIPVTFLTKDMNGQNVSGVMVRLYLENPYNKGGISLKKGLIPILKGITNANGVFTVNMAIPTHKDSLYAIIDGYNNPITMKVIKGGLNKTIYPPGFGIRTIKTRAYPTGYSPKVYNNLNSNFLADGCWILGDYTGTGFDSDGKPNFIDVTESVPGSLLAGINSTLPEVPQNIPNNHPNLIADASKANLVITDNVNIWITFVSEGAGYQNMLGYYYYKTADGQPATSSQLFKKTIVFPNSSALGSDGQLAQGDRVKLMFCDPNADPTISDNWSDIFPPGYTLGWFLISNGYSAYPTGIQFTNYAYNGGGLSQTVLLYDGVTGKVVLGIEDIGRTGASDEDFNDCVFYITANPLTAIYTGGLNTLAQNSGDTDGDGVPDNTDEYPNDINRAFNNYYPDPITYGSLAFEDNWPSKGDYDFNDLVLDYQIKYVTNAAGTVKDVYLQTRTQAIGAAYRNGFAWEINANQSNIESVSTVYSGPGTLLAGSLFPLDAKGYESGITASKVVIPFFDNAYTLFGASSLPNYVNTITGATVYSAVSLTKKVTFTSPVAIGTLGSLPFNPFIIVNQNRGKEVHKVGQHGTSKANVAYYNTSDDKTNQSNLWYVGLQNYPWVLDTPEPFEYPIEDMRNSVNIADVFVSKAFKRFDTWTNSNGASYTDWHINTAVGYRDNNYIYTRH